MGTVSEYELNLLKFHLSKCTNYLEFGCGESTFLAASQNNIKNILTFDSSFNSIIKVVNKCIANNIRNVRTIHLDIGEVSEWGYPIKHDERIYLNYSLEFIQFLPPGIEYDFIFIDGRFRVATALLSSLYLKDTGCIAIHDYRDRDQYYILEYYFGKVTSADTLYIFKKRTDFNVKDMFITLSTYLTDPR